MSGRHFTARCPLYHHHEPQGLLKLSHTALAGFSLADTIDHFDDRIETSYLSKIEGEGRISTASLPGLFLRRSAPHICGIDTDKYDEFPPAHICHPSTGRRVACAG